MNRLFENFDLQMLTLNITSGVGFVAWMTENANGGIGLLLVLSVVALNFAKSFAVTIKAKAEVRKIDAGIENKEDEDETK